MTTESHVVTWNWAGTAVDVGAKEAAGLPQNPQHRRKPPGVIWHPVRRDAFFLSFISRQGDEGTLRPRHLLFPAYLRPCFCVF